MYTDHYKNDAKRIAGDDDFIVIQFSGGQPPAGFAPQNGYVSSDPTRNYHPYLAQKVVDQIKEKYEDLKILNFSLPNEPNYEQTIKPDLMPFAQWHEIESFCTKCRKKRCGNLGRNKVDTIWI